MVHEMRRRGIRIDQSAAERARDYCLRKRDAALAELSDQLGSTVSMNEIASPRWKAETFDAHRITYPRTEKGNPSFKAGKLGWMATHPHWLPQLIATASKYEKAGSTFLETHILDHLIGGRVYAEINPHRSEEGGTRSFRFSYSSPPLQQMPSRDKELGPLIRSAFLPEEGEIWCKPDISQQEFRLAVHHAFIRNLAGAHAAIERYRADPDTDFHALAGEVVGVPRDDAKHVNFAKLYGAGVKKFAVMIGKPLGEAQVLYEQYDRRFPFVAQLATACEREARRQGFTVLYDGARRHWDRWAPGGKWSKGLGPCVREEAIARANDPAHPWHRRTLWRANVHTAMNALIQGSAARHTKLWMRACWREGIVPLLQMHDALDCSVTEPKQGELMARLGCAAVTLEVPMQIDVKYGRNWGDATHSWAELHELPTPIEPVIAVEPSIEIPTEMPRDPPPLETPTPTPPPRYNGFAHDNFDSEISLRDVVGEPLVHNKVCCPFHDDATPSCHIYHDHYHCFACGAHGDAISWLMEVEGLSFTGAQDALACWEPRQRPAAELEDDGKTLERARKLWDAAQLIAGTRAADYLTFRHIDVDQLPSGDATALRFHPNCPFGEGFQHPCLLALFQDVDSDAFAGIHRIALTASAFAPGGTVERRMLGRWPGRRAIKLWPASRVLFVGEGVETVLAAATRLAHKGHPLRPAWALASAGALARCGPIADVDCVVVLADNDPTGRRDAQDCAQRWSASERKAVVLTPRREGEDFNDIVRKRAS